MTISEADLMAHCTVKSTVFHDLLSQLQDVTWMFPAGDWFQVSSPSETSCCENVPLII